MGETPKIKETGSSVRGRSAIARSGHAKYMPAMVALKHNPSMKALGGRLKSDGLAPKAVIAACMQKLIRQLYGVLKSRNAFDATFLGHRLDVQAVYEPNAWLLEFGGVCRAQGQAVFQMTSYTQTAIS